MVRVVDRLRAAGATFDIIVRGLPRNELHRLGPLVCVPLSTHLRAATRKLNLADTTVPRRDGDGRSHAPAPSPKASGAARSVAGGGRGSGRGRGGGSGARRPASAPKPARSSLLAVSRQAYRTPSTRVVLHYDALVLDAEMAIYRLQRSAKLVREQGAQATDTRGIAYLPGTDDRRQASLASKFMAEQRLHPDDATRALKLDSHNRINKRIGELQAQFRNAMQVRAVPRQLGMASHHAPARPPTRTHEFTPPHTTPPPLSHVVAPHAGCLPGSAQDREGDRERAAAAGAQLSHVGA